MLNVANPGLKKKEKINPFSDRTTHQIMVDFFKSILMELYFIVYMEKKTRMEKASSNEAGLRLPDIAIDYTNYN